MRNINPKQHPYTHKPVAFFEALDYPTLYPAQWSKLLAACEDDEDEARMMAVNILLYIHSPVHGPITRELHDKRLAFRQSIGRTFRWDHRRFLRNNRAGAKGKRQAMRYWRAMTKGSMRSQVLYSLEPPEALDRWERIALREVSHV